MLVNVGLVIFSIKLVPFFVCHLQLEFIEEASEDSIRQTKHLTLLVVRVMRVPVVTKRRISNIADFIVILEVLVVEIELCYKCVLPSQIGNYLHSIDVV